MTVFYVVRHGQSTWNLAGLVQGQTAGPELTALGHAQAHAAADRLDGLAVDAVLSSDQHRAVQTAIPIAARLGVSVTLSRGLRERSYGTLEGQPTVRAVEIAGEIDWTDADAKPGGAESLRELHARLARVVEACTTAYPDGVVVLVSHGDAIRSLHAWWSGLGPHEIPWRDVGNGSVAELPSRAGKWSPA